MRLVALLLLVVFIAGVVFTTVAYVRADYQYEREVQSFWNLSVKASTLDAKAAYLDKYVAALEASPRAPANAKIFVTPDVTWEQNMAVLKTLQQRMHEIRGMDVTSFQYQQAMQQITGQEQDEASHMLAQLKGCWYLGNHPLFWDWYFGLVVFLIAIVGIGVLIALAFAFGD